MLGMPFLMPVSILLIEYFTMELSCSTFTFLRIFKGKSQIIGLIFLAEIITEASGTHYTKGGDLPTVVFPPIDFSTVDDATMSVKKDRELNNGRLAMIAIMSFVAAANIPGSVPALAGNPMF